jgi:hypothetical protein
MSEQLMLKYRPKKWSEVIGQDHIVQTLQNGLASGDMHQTYIFLRSLRRRKDEQRPHPGGVPQLREVQEADARNPAASAAPVKKSSRACRRTSRR